MKKFFSLVLALVMALSLTTAAWGAPVNVANLTQLKQAITDQATEINVTAAIPIAEDISLSNVTITTSVIEPFNVTAGTLTLGTGVVINAADAIFEVSGTGKVVINGAELNVVGSGVNCAVCAKNGGTIELVSGSINQSGVDKVTVSIRGTGASLVMSGGAITSADSSALIAYEGGTATISGGTVTSANNYAAYACGGGSITVNGGTVTNDVDDKPALVASATYGGSGGSVTVKSGTVKGVKAHEADTSTVAIEGGNITGPVSTANDATLTITGGTFTDDSAEAYLADGLTLTADGVVVSEGGAALATTYDIETTDISKTKTVGVTVNTYAAKKPKDTSDPKDGLLDQPGNVKYVEFSNMLGRYFVQVNTVKEADYTVYQTGTKTVFGYFVEVGSPEYLGNGVAFYDFGEKCGQYDETPEVGAAYYLFQGVLFQAVDPDEVTPDANLMVGSKLTPVVALNDEFVDHAPIFTYDKDYKVVGVKCDECGTPAVIYPNYAAVPKADKVAGNAYPVNDNDYYCWLAGPVADTETKVESADTFDAGIAMYVGMSVMAAAGSVVVLKKKD